MLGALQLTWDGWGFFLVMVGAVGAYGSYRRWRTHRQPVLFYSQVRDLEDEKTSWLLRLRPWIGRLLWIAVFFLLLALLDIRLLVSPAGVSTEDELAQLTPIEGTAIYLVLDRSGSMRRKVLVQPAEELPYQETRLQLLKEVTERFIEGHPNDLFGLVTFARTAQIEAPLTLDHQTVRRRLLEIKAVDDPNEDGTGIGYAIYKTVSSIVATRHFGETLTPDEAPPYTIHDAVLLVVTDGFQSPNPMDEGQWLRAMGLEDAAAYAREHGVKVFLVSIEPVLLEEEFEPFRIVMRRAARSTGGDLFITDSVSSLDEVYAEIDALERNVVTRDSLAYRKSEELQSEWALYPWFAAFAVVAVSCTVLIETLIIRPVP